uniref:Uncharacterized protein n=1 Tax=Rhizophora mucronata TaxID=61149 RepID=A0A2P2Q217_RHIMU
MRKVDFGTPIDFFFFFPACFWWGWTGRPLAQEASLMFTLIQDINYHIMLSTYNEILMI